MQGITIQQTKAVVSITLSSSEGANRSFRRRPFAAIMNTRCLWTFLLRVQEVELNLYRFLSFTELNYFIYHLSFSQYNVLYFPWELNFLNTWIFSKWAWTRCHSRDCQSEAVGKDEVYLTSEVCFCVLGFCPLLTMALWLQAETVFRGWENTISVLTYQLEGETQCHKYPLSSGKAFLGAEKLQICCIISWFGV